MSKDAHAVSVCTTEFSKRLGDLVDIYKESKILLDRIGSVKGKESQRILDSTRRCCRNLDREWGAILRFGGRCF